MQLETIAYYLALVPTIVVAITFHEFAHAWTALKFGDPTASHQGRVTLNPIAHLDPLGTALFFVAGFGWGKPTPVNRSAFRHPRADLAVSAAGPLSNIVLAGLAGLILRVPFVMPALEGLGIAEGVAYLVPLFVYLNLILAFFNLMPVWPLDGSHVVENLLPLNAAIRFGAFGRAYGTYLLLGLILLDRLTGVSILGLTVVLPASFLTSVVLGY